MRLALVLALAAPFVAAGAMVAFTAVSRAPGGDPGSPAPAIAVVAAENQYASVAQAIGGRYVDVKSVMSNPSVDPHTYEASTAVAIEIAGARLVIQNGLGYDGFMNKIEAAAPSRNRLVLTVGTALGYARTAPNPHLWYRPSTMPQVARRIADDLSRLMPARAAYFRARVSIFDASLAAWSKALERLKAAYKGAPVAVTEPVADYMLQAAGLSIMTPWTFQAAVMNGTDPSPQDVSVEDGLLTAGKVRVLVYNRQAVDAVTLDLLALARAHHVPVVGVYETMPPGYTYATWMTAETEAVDRALRDHRSTAVLK